MAEGNLAESISLLLQFISHPSIVILQNLVLVLELGYVLSICLHSGGGSSSDLLDGNDLQGVGGDLAGHLFLHPDHGVGVVGQLLAYLIEFGIEQINEVRVRHDVDTLKIKIVQMCARFFDIFTIFVAERFAIVHVLRVLSLRCSLELNPARFYGIFCTMCCSFINEQTNGIIFHDDEPQDKTKNIAEKLKEGCFGILVDTNRTSSYPGL